MCDARGHQWLCLQSQAFWHEASPAHSNKWGIRIWWYKPPRVFLIDFVEVEVEEDQLDIEYQYQEVVTIVGQFGITEIGYSSQVHAKYATTWSWMSRPRPAKSAGTGRCGKSGAMTEVPTTLWAPCTALRSPRTSTRWAMGKRQKLKLKLYIEIMKWGSYLI